MDMSREIIRQYVGRVYMIYPSMAAAELGLPILVVRETIENIYQNNDDINGRRLIKRLDQDYLEGIDIPEDRHYFEVEL